MGVNRYTTFGFRKHWLTDYLLKGRDYLDSNLLGKYQKIAFMRYLKDAEIADDEGNLTTLGFILKKLISKDTELVWQVIWINLTQNSELFNWYATEIPWNSTFTKEYLERKLSEDKGIKPRTAKNAINALFNTFKNSPLGNWAGKIEKRNITKEGLKILKPELLAYTIKKFNLYPENGLEVMQKSTGINSLTYSSAFVLLDNVKLWEGL